MSRCSNWSLSIRNPASRKQAMTLLLSSTDLTFAAQELAEPAPDTPPLKKSFRGYGIEFEFLPLKRHLLGAEVSHLDEFLEVCVEHAVAQVQPGLELPSGGSVLPELGERPQYLQAHPGDESAVHVFGFFHDCYRSSGISDFKL